MCQFSLFTICFHQHPLGILKNNRMKSSKEKFGLNIRKIFLTVRSIRMGNRLPRSVGRAPHCLSHLRRRQGKVCSEKKIYIAAANIKLLRPAKAMACSSIFPVSLALTQPFTFSVSPLDTFLQSPNYKNGERDTVQN